MASDSFFEIEITVSVLWPFFAVPCVDLRLVSVVFPDHTHLLLLATSTNTRRIIKQNKGSFVQRTGDQADVCRIFI